MDCGREGIQTHHRQMDVATGAHLVALPYPGSGHINPMLNLCRQLAGRSLLITVVVTEEWLSLLSDLISSLPSNIRLRTIPNVIPSERTRGADFSGFLRAVLTEMKAPVERLLDELDSVRAVIADTYLPWAVRVGKQKGVPVVSLWTEPVAVFTVFHHFDLLAAKYNLPRSLQDIEEDEIVDCVPGIKDARLSDLHSFCFNKEFLQVMQDEMSCVRDSHSMLLTSPYELEPDLINFLRSSTSISIYPVGPSIPYFNLQDRPSGFDKTLNYLSWLDSQPKNSVLYVSLGSFLLISESQIQEIFNGLEHSGIRYLWVRRQSFNQSNLRTSKGLEIPWCDQLKVLCHPSIGAFWTHCGWNSTMEAVYAGVPMLCLPLSFDQFTCCKLIVDEWKVGLRLWRQGEVKLLRREEIAEAVGMVMDDDQSKELRKRAIELREACRGALVEGGSSCHNLDAFVRDLLGQSDKPPHSCTPSDL